MNIVVAGFHNPTHFPIIENVMKALKVEYCQIIYDDVRITPPLGSEVVFLQDGPINTVAAYDVDWNEMRPLDADILSKMEHCEAVVMKMMERLNKTGQFETYERRREIYLKHVRYWNNLLSCKRIDAAVFDVIPHQVYDYIMWELCQKAGIPCITLFQTNIHDTTLFFNSFDDFSPELRQQYEQLLSLKTPEVGIEDLAFTPRSMAFLDTQIGKDSLPFYTQEYLAQRSREAWTNVGKGLRYSIVAPLRLIPKTVATLRYKRLNWKLRKVYQSLCVPPKLEKRFIFVPLHYQPECTTSPMGGVFVDQLLMLQLLSACLPPDVCMYVKEHVAQDHRMRSREFYEGAASLPNVHLISTKWTSFQLIERCCAVATVTGTAGLEALIRERPVLLFGSIFYQYCRGVFKVSTIEECQDAMRQIFNEGRSPRLPDVLVFLKAVEMTSINGYIGAYYAKISRLSEEDNVTNLTEAIVKRMEELCPSNRAISESDAG